MEVAAAGAMETDAARIRRGTKSERQQEENVHANNNSGISEAKKPRSGDDEEVKPESYRSKFMFFWNHMCAFEDISTFTFLCFFFLIHSVFGRDAC